MTLILGVRPFVVGVGVGHVGLEVGLFVEALAAQFALVLFLGLAHLFRVDVTDVSSFGRLGKRLRERAFSTPAIPSFNPNQTSTVPPSSIIPIIIKCGRFQVNDVNDSGI